MEDNRRKTSSAVDATDGGAAQSHSEVARLEKHRRDFYEASRDGYVRADLDWHIIEFNSSLVKLLGYSREQLLSLSCRSLVPDKWRDILGRVYRDQVLVKGYSDLFEMELLRADGKVVLVEAQTYLSRNERGEPESIWASLRDISTNACPAAAVTELEHHLRILADTAFDWVYWIDPMGRVVHNSHSCLRVTGFPGEVFLNDPSRILAIVHPDDRAMFEEHINAEAYPAGEDTIQFRIVRADGEVRWMEHRCVSMYDRDGRLLGRRACNADITQRKATERALQDSLERFQTLAEQSLMGIGIYNVEGMAFLNQALADIVEYPIEQIRTWSFENIAAMIYPTDYDLIVDRFRRRLDGDDSLPNRYQMRMVTGRGATKWVDLFATRVTLEGRPYIITNLVDITELVTARASLEKANRTLQEQHVALEEKNTVLRGVLNQIESEKQSIAMRIQTNLERIVLPHVRALRATAAPLEQTFLDQIESSIHDVTSEFVERLTTLGADLAPREIQVCSLIRDGLSTKEIAEACNVSVRTVEVWRKRIRRKLGLANRAVNLTSYLRSLEK